MTGIGEKRQASRQFVRRCASSALLVMYSASCSFLKEAQPEQTATPPPPRPPADVAQIAAPRDSDPAYRFDFAFRTATCMVPGEPRSAVFVVELASTNHRLGTPTPLSLGDRLVEIYGTRIHNTHDLNLAMTSASRRTELRLVVARKGTADGRWHLFHYVVHAAGRYDGRLFRRVTTDGTQCAKIGLTQSRELAR
jgi:hypothetical protein